MKKIIDGKLYNTETAECLGVYQDFDPKTFHYYHEALYLTKKGTYFVYSGKGIENPSADDSVLGMDVSISLFSRENAMLWAEIRLTAEKYFSLFGRPTEK